MNFIDKMVERFIKLNRRMKRWQRVVSVMAAVVVFATTYALILPAITLDKDTATAESGIEVAASENEAGEAGTVFENTEEEPAPEETAEEPEEAVAEDSGSESGSQEAEAAQAEAVAEENTSEVAPEGNTSEAAPEDESEQKEVLTTEEAATYGTTEEAIAAVTGQTAEEVKLITEDTQLTFDGSDYVVYADFGESAKLPEGVQLQVKEITKESDPEAYEMYYQKALSEMQGKYDENTTLSFAKFYDIAFVYEGVEIEPSGNVNVRIEYKQAVEIEKTTTVDTIHFDKNDEEKAEVIDSDTEGTEKEVEAVQFESDRFSVYGVVGTETITVEHIDHKGTKYEVTVTYGPEAKIPEGSTLSVTDIEEGTDEYEYARNAVLADKQAKGEEVFLPEFGFAALDISILNPAGEEIEPAAPVQVDIKIKSLPNVENLDDVADSIEIQHHVETGDKVVVDTVYDGGTSEAQFNVATNEEAIAGGTAVDPGSYKPKELGGIEDLGEIDASFETEAFSTYTISWGNRSYKIHYVDTNGNSLTPTRTPEFSNDYEFLIYDVEGYEYDSTHYGSRTGTAIKPLLAYYYVRYSYSYDRAYLDNNNNWQSLRNDIYVVYKPKEAATPGGTPKVDEDETWPDQEDPARKPQFTKSSTNNGNNTNNISLTITAPEKPVSKSTPADVIVVFDVSGSMNENLSGNTKRLAAAKTAVNNMANTLLNGQNSNVRMALISFATTAQQVNITGATDGFTSNYSNFSSAVNGLTADGGTNWEKALQLANQMQVRSDAATFVVFVTDGDPTFRVSRGDVSDSELDLYTSQTYQYYRNNQVFGTGSSDNSGRNFAFAVDQVSTIAGANKNFYAIGISNDVTKVQNLTTQGGVAADHAFIASDTTAMENAFKSITEAIKATLGFGNVEMTDGITALTNAEMKVMQTVDPNSFKYYRYGGENNKYGNGYANKTEWTTREADGCAAASYSESDGAVHWDMGETFQLENGVTYVVEFTVWPSQAAYDLVADLNNGIKTYDSLTPEEKAQIVEVTAPTETTTGTYALKTNTDKVETTYNRTTKSGDTVSVSDTTDVLADYHEGTIQNMALDDSFVTITKEWINVIPGDTREAATVNLAVTKDNVTYISPITLSKNNDWTSGKEYISAGLITHVSGTTGRYTIREAGHEYTVSEPAEGGNNGYYWDLTADIYRPMVIDGTLHVLIKTSNPTGTEGTDYYVIGGNNYQVSDGQTNLLKATNNRRSVLDLSKEVIKEEGASDNPDPNTLFTYTITITGSDGADIWFSAQDKDGATVAIPTTSSNVVAEMGTDGNPTGYYHVPSGAKFTITMKADWRVRFINLPNGTTYSIEETGVGEGYEFVEATTSVTNKSGENLGTPGTVNGDVVTGTIDKPNNEFDVDYTNKWLSKGIKIVKVDENGSNLAGATFTLTRGRETITTFTSKADEGETMYVGKGTYCLTETAAPDGYIILTNKIYFNVNADGTVALSNEEGGTEGVTYENATVSNPPTTELGTVTVSNEPGKELPHTGGPGTLLYTLSGLMLILASALMYGFRMRRGERRIR